MPSPAEIIPEFLILVFSLSFHEAAHAWTADRLGDPTARQMGRLTLNPLAHIDWIGTVLFPLIALFSNLPLLGWAKPVPVDGRNLRAPRQDFAMVALAGPASNLVLACGFAALRFLLAGGHAQAMGVTVAGDVLMMAVVINVILAVFNLFPVPPLDGSNVLMGVLPDAGVRIMRVMRPYGFLILYGLMFSGILFRVMDPIEQMVLGWLL